MNKNKCVFLDRDGVIIKDVGYLKYPEGIIIFQDVIESLKRLQEANFLLIIVTNQAGIAKGFFTEADLEAVHKKLNSIFIKEGVIIDGLYYCPHHKDGTLKPYSIECNCRKPNTGMVLKAKDKFNINLNKSFMIGDKDSDIELAINSGLKSFYIRNTMYEHNETIKPDFEVANLKEAVNIILSSFSELD
jgi:D-glycero-D-manno-heptose 1,7-bisphosphate phosphatase